MRFPAPSWAPGMFVLVSGAEAARQAEADGNPAGRVWCVCALLDARLSGRVDDLPRRARERISAGTAPPCALTLERGHL